LSPLPRLDGHDDRDRSAPRPDTCHRLRGIHECLAEHCPGSLPGDCRGRLGHGSAVPHRVALRRTVVCPPPCTSAAARVLGPDAPPSCCRHDSVCPGDLGDRNVVASLEYLALLLPGADSATGGGTRSLVR